ncbi:HU family DNA-binding protein [Photobacterium kishitanii]|uniref:HU family DNA-binding protein n=1 Tax=Photobacterium kishitanii TaxID=318456 RepID=A0A2T3KMA3_9GAMM|nr:HU family DNA-binding protein [Photobacterium kishitanii]PSV00930.1 hypothetical protein C9J27_02590 [Photobacterium kishitanii]
MTVDKKNSTKNIKITRDVLAQRIFKNANIKGVSLKDSKNMLESILEHIKTSVFGKGKILRIKNYGRLTPKIKPSGRPVRNPSKGDEYFMEETATVTLTKQQGRSNKENRFTENQFILDFTSTNNKLSKYEVSLAKITAQELFNAIRETKEIGVRCEIREFAVFSSAMSNPRRARNPKTGEPVFVPSKPKAIFTISREFRKDLLKKLKEI